MSEPTEADKIIAYIEQQKKRKNARDGLLVALVLLVFAIGGIAFWLGGTVTGFEVTMASFVVAIVVGAVYTIRHP